MFGVSGRATRIVFQVVVALALGCAPAASETPGHGLVTDLRAGGYTLFVRHFATDHSQEDTDPLHPENVAAQRQLSDVGRSQAAALGEALRKLAIPIGSIAC